MNCKPDDLAYIVHDSGSSALGLVVDVRRRSDRDDGTPCWIVGVPAGCFLECRKTGRKVEATEFRIPDAWLRPISGVPMTDDTTDEVAA